MNQDEITIFGNFRIDSGERFQRMKDSHASMKNLKINRWVINIRGPLKAEAMKYLEVEIGDKLVSYCLESDDGWFHDTRQMIKNIQTHSLLFWIEDHICVCEPSKLNKLIHEFNEEKIDYMQYTWFDEGRLVKAYEGIKRDERNALFIINYDKYQNNLLQKNYQRLIGTKVFINSCAGIYSLKLFKKIVESNHPFLKRWPKKFPFDFEKNYADTFILPFTLGLPKYELFAAIDDDNIFEGSSLIKRGLYPDRVSRPELLQIRSELMIEDSKWAVPKYFPNNPMIRKLTNFWKRLLYTLN